MTIGGVISEGRVVAAGGLWDKVKGFLGGDRDDEEFRFRARETPGGLSGREEGDGVFRFRAREGPGRAQGQESGRRVIEVTRKEVDKYGTTSVELDAYSAAWDHFTRVMLDVGTLTASNILEVEERLKARELALAHEIYSAAERHTLGTRTVSIALPRQMDAQNCVPLSFVSGLLYLEDTAVIEQGGEEAGRAVAQEVTRKNWRVSGGHVDVGKPFDYLYSDAVRQIEMSGVYDHRKTDRLLPMVAALSRHAGVVLCVEGAHCTFAYDIQRRGRELVVLKHDPFNPGGQDEEIPLPRFRDRFGRKLRRYEGMARNLLPRAGKDVVGDQYREGKEKDPAGVNAAILYRVG